MNFNEQIEIEKQYLLNELNSKFKMIDIGNIDRIAKDAEDLFVREVSNLFFRNINKISSNSQSIQSIQANVRFIKRGKILFDVFINRDILNRGVLLIFIKERRISCSDKELTSEKRFDFSICGRFSSITLSYPKTKIKINHEYLFRLVDELYCSTQNWTRSKFHKALRENIKDSTDDLYNYVIDTIKDPDVLSGIAIGIFFRDPKTNRFVDTTILNSRFAEYFVQRASKYSPLLHKSPIALASQIIGEVIDQDYSPISRAFKEARPITINPQRSQEFYGHHFEFNETLRAIWPLGFVIYPIAETGGSYFTGLFPVENRSYLIKYFNMHKAEIAKRAIEKTSLINRLLGKLKSIGSGIDAKDAGEFTAGFLWEVVKRTFLP